MEYIGTFPPDLATGAMWPQIAKLLERSIPYGMGEYSIDDIRSGLNDGSLIAIGVSVDGTVQFVAVCSVQQFPRKRVLYVVHGAGRGGSRCASALNDAGRALGCDWIETRTRTSVARLYQRLGFNTGYVVPIMEISQ